MEASEKIDPIQVMVVDDSALMRNLVSRIVESSPDLTVAATAMNGKFALAKIETAKPDVMVLDLEMPEMNGIGFLRERKARGIEIPVVILSSVAQKGASITMEALSLGASDFIMKPSGSVSEDIHVIGEQLVELLRYYGRAYKRGRATTVRPQSLGPRPTMTTVVAPAQDAPIVQAQPSGLRFRTVSAEVPKEKPTPHAKPGNLELIALGISTGGPNALRQVFSKLRPDLGVPMVVVQHMPAGFTQEFAKSLDRICPLEVKEAEDGDLIKPGRILIAPGDKHIRLEKRSLATVLVLDDSPPVNGHRPSVDVLFESVAQLYGNRAMGIIMTGMGKDGAEKLGLIYRAGGITLGQDESSSVVYGMPRVAFDHGHVTRQVALDEMANTINEYVAQLSH